MASSRKSQVSLEDTPYYHCISRCVRRAYLCGRDSYSGRSFEHRRKLIEEKILLLSAIFAIDVCSYAVMSNHFHVVLHVNQGKAEEWTIGEVITRWHSVFKGTQLTNKYLNDISSLSDDERLSIERAAQIYRERLKDISWYMRVINEGIARQANKEDNCSGRFWEGRFKSQALLGDVALAACMAYVDLNPIRANIANTVEDSNFTSIKLRANFANRGKQPDSLMRLSNSSNSRSTKVLPFEYKDYLAILKVARKGIKNEGNGFVTTKQQSIFRNLGIKPENWILITCKFSKLFRGAVGCVKQLSKFYEHKSMKRRPNIRICASLLN